MAFNVTQCPVCESTFNTNARVLESAVGRVRCGACLAVFDAASNYIEQADADAGYPTQESVFVGNDPQEFFDPSKFLTRSALTETDDSLVASEAENGGIEASDDEDLFDSYQQVRASEDDIVGSSLEQPLAEQEPGGDGEAEQSSSYKQTPELGNFNENDEENTRIEGSPEQEAELSDHYTDELDEEPPAATDQKLVLLQEKWEEIETETQKKIDSSVEQAENSTASEIAEVQNPQLQFPEKSFEAEGDNIHQLELHSHDEDANLTPPILDWSALEGERPAALPPTDEADESSFTLMPDADVESVSEPELEAEPESKLEAEHSFDLGPPQEQQLQESIKAREAAEDQRPKEPPEESSASIRARALEAELDDEEALEALPEETLAMLGKMSTPLELPLSSNSQWGRRIALSLAIVALAALLSAQYLWQSIEVYSQRAQTRPLYELICNWLSCELPSYSEIGAIRSDNLVVRSHPELANGLMVRTTIRNTAEFPQAFPIMVLSFNSASNSIVALREFTPAEYLDPGLQSLQAMPAMTPVQIDLEIIDPGPDAVNYTLAFRLP